MSKDKLNYYYNVEKKSIKDISIIFNKSETGINYWMKRFGIKKRSISEALYLKNNPDGDPFSIKKDLNVELAELKGFGLGLYWGEGNKTQKNSIKLGNTDPELIKKFIEFLVKILGIKKERIRFSLQVFSDMDPEKARNFWIKELGVSRAQFSNKVTVTKSGKIGNYKKKSKYGVLTVYYNNTKLRNILISMLPL